MQGITFSGLGSGLDTSAIIAQLVSLERIPIRQIEGQRQEQQSKLSLIGTFKGLVRDLQTEAQSLSTLADFASFDVSASLQGVASFGASGSAVAGSHTLDVQSLAAVDRWAFDGVTDPTAQLATGAGQSLSFDVAGESYSVAIDETASSLEEIAAAINGSEAAEAVGASIVNTGTDASPSYQLVLTARESGADNRITNLANTVGGLSIDTTGPDANGVAQSANNITVGANAVATIDGLTVTRDTNEFNDVIPGVDITLQSLTEEGPISFSVEPNTAAIKDGIQQFVDAYNAVIDFVNTQNSYSEDGGPGGDLFGDSLLRSVRSQLNGALFGFEQRQDIDIGALDADSEVAGFATLGIIGIELDNDGRLSIDDTVFDAKVSENLDLVADLFVDSDGFDNGGATVNTPEYYADTTADAGLAAILDRTIERLFDSFEDTEGNVFKGLFDSRTETLQDAIRRMDRQIEDKELRLEQFEENLIQRFAALEETIGGLNAQGASLNAALLGLSS